MIWLAFAFSIGVTVVVGLLTHDWKRAFRYGILVLVLGIIAAFLLATAGWFLGR